MVRARSRPAAPVLEVQSPGARPGAAAGTRTGGRIPGPAELAGAALFLATDDAAHITGGYLVADGGYKMVGA